MSSEMELVVDAGGDVRCVYGEELDLRELGRLQITRVSHVEPDRDGFWSLIWGLLMGRCWGPSGAGRRRFRRRGGGWQTTASFGTARRCGRRRTIHWH